jgi:hypothetical protein
MSASRFGFSVLVMSLVLAACATTKTQTNRDLNYQGHPSRIYVVAGVAKLGDSFTDELQKRMVDGIQGCGGQAAFERVSGLELDPTARNARVQQFKPDIVLSIEITSWETYQSAITANIDSRVWDVASKKWVWRAATKLNAGGLTPASTRAESLSTDLLSKLRSDGMIPTCPTNPS